MMCKYEDEDANSHHVVCTQGTSLRWQAHTVHSASVVVMVHGPALATSVFMARHAALVHIVPSTVYPMQQHLQTMVRGAKTY